VGAAFLGPKASTVNFLGYNIIIKFVIINAPGNLLTKPQSYETSFIWTGFTRLSGFLRNYFFR